MNGRVYERLWIMNVEIEMYEHIYLTTDWLTEWMNEWVNGSTTDWVIPWLTEWIDICIVYRVIMCNITMWMCKCMNMRKKIPNHISLRFFECVTMLPWLPCCFTHVQLFFEQNIQSWNDVKQLSVFVQNTLIKETCLDGQDQHRLSQWSELEAWVQNALSCSAQCTFKISSSSKLWWMHVISFFGCNRS